MKKNNILEIEVYSNDSICQEHSYFSESFVKELQSSVHFQLTNSIFSQIILVYSNVLVEA